MKSYLLSTLLMLILSLHAHGKSPLDKKFDLSGTIVDQETQDPLEYATITVLNKAGEAVSGALSNAEGAFSIRLSGGEYQLRIQYISYTTWEKPISLDADLDLGQIEVTPDKVLLDAVEIVDEKTRVELNLDKKIYNIGKDLTAQGGSVNDVLGNVPSINVSPEGGISLRGDGGVQVLINGKPSVLTANNGLESLPAGSVERVEVITNPSARYQAAGTSGIINIVLKKNRLKGISGSVALSTGIPAEHVANLNLNYKNEKVNLFGALGGRYSNFNGGLTNYQSVTQGGVTTILDQLGDQDRNDQARNYFLGADIYLNERNTLTTSFFHRYLKNTDVTVLDYNYDTGSGSFDSSVTRTIDYLEPQNYNQFELSYVKTFPKPQQRWTVDFQYDFWNDDENEAIRNAYFGAVDTGLTEFRTRDIESSDDFLLQSDYVHPIGKKGRFETGFRAETRVITSRYYVEEWQSEQWETFRDLDNDLDYFERIGAAYVQYGNEIKKFNYLLGLRAEYTQIGISDVRDQFETEKDYLRFFPTAHLNYKLAEASQLQLSYSRRIRRPSFWHLNPFGGFSDNNAIREGNPDMDPSYTNSLEFSYLFNKDKISINPSLYFQQTTDFFQFYTELQEDGTFVTSPFNQDNEYRGGLELLTTYRPVNWLQLYGELNYYQYIQRGEFENQDFDFEFDTWSTEFGVRARFPKGFRLQSNLEYQGRSQNAQTLNRSVTNLHLALTKSLLKDKASLTFIVNNALNLRRTRAVTTGEGFFSEIDQYWIQRRYRLTFNYQFNRKANEQDRRPGRQNR